LLQRLTCRVRMSCAPSTHDTTPPRRRWTACSSHLAFGSGSRRSSDDGGEPPDDPPAIAILTAANSPNDVRPLPRPWQSQGLRLSNDLAFSCVIPSAARATSAETTCWATVLCHYLCAPHDQDPPPLPVASPAPRAGTRRAHDTTPSHLLRLDTTFSSSTTPPHLECSPGSSPSSNGKTPSAQSPRPPPAPRPTEPRPVQVAILSSGSPRLLDQTREPRPPWLAHHNLGRRGIIVFIRGGPSGTAPATARA
jgi:hypothetical protein